MPTDELDLLVDYEEQMTQGEHTFVEANIVANIIDHLGPTWTNVDQLKPNLTN